MPRLLIGNRSSDDLIGTWGKSSMGWWALRLLWFVQDGDVVVLPEAPDEEFLEYVMQVTGTDRSTVTLVHPPAGQSAGGEDDAAEPGEWLLAPEVVHGLRRAFSRTIGDGCQTEETAAVETVFALCPDATVVELARRLGVEAALPGADFLREGGAAIADSKVVFRALAAGSRLPLPEGGVAANREEAQRLVTSLLETKQPVILKKEFLAGGGGNEVLTYTPDIQVNGAHRTIVLDPNKGEAAVRAYLDERWEWLTEGDRHRVVVERFYPGSRAVFAEFWISEEKIELGGQGELVAAPVADHSYIPAPNLSTEQRDNLVAGGRRLCELLKAMGYRGVLSADAILVDGKVLFTEYNGLVTGSTHVYYMGRRLAGSNYARDRVLCEHVAWNVPSFADARVHLAREGIAYDPATRTGVVLLNAWRASSGTVPYCVIAANVDAAEALEKRLRA